MIRALQKDRDSLCERIDHAMDLLAQVKEAIEADNIDEAFKLEMSLKTTCENLPNFVKDYINRRNLQSANNTR